MFESVKSGVRLLGHKKFVRDDQDWIREKKVYTKGMEPTTQVWYMDIYVVCMKIGAFLSWECSGTCRKTPEAFVNDSSIQWQIKITYFIYPELIVYLFLSEKTINTWSEEKFPQQVKKVFSTIL